jgi:hypothetical protein
MVEEAREGEAGLVARKPLRSHQDVKTSIQPLGMEILTACS